MTVYVFVGPSLAADRLRDSYGFEFLPPAAQGDLYRAAQKRPRAIAIIDGYFEGVPAVWHKEILWAMSQGIHMFGSASMGALRASELHAFGMRGVGRIFQAYSDGTLEDDDEVAVLHGPAELGYVALSEAMVNIRATLDRAAADSVVTATTRDALEQCAKKLFYQDRTWDAVLALGAELGLPAAELAALEEWLPSGRVDLKADDASAMLSEISSFLAEDPGPVRVQYSFEWTDMWDTAISNSRTFGFDQSGEMGNVPNDRLLDELRLDNDAYRSAKTAALARLLGLRAADRQGLTVERGAVSDILARLRGAFGLYRRAELEQWLTANDLSAEDLERLMTEEARLEACAPLVEPVMQGPLLDHLRVSGAYARLAGRAHRKQSALTALGLPDPEPADLGLTPLALAHWYFEERRGQTIPDDLDEFARSIGLADRVGFYRLVTREYLFLSDAEHKDEDAYTKER